ncbi:MAG TPA: hypothetical protein VFZ34_30425, partial [Blastocatellia bacterium]|nr:hypothetical protein [Blastocatellia bacterium]
MNRSVFRAILIALAVVVLAAACKNSSPSTNAPAAGSEATASKPDTGTCYNAYYPATPTLKK